VVLPLDYGVELSRPEPRGGCKPLLTEKGVQLVGGVSMKDVGGVSMRGVCSVSGSQPSLC